MAFGAFVALACLAGQLVGLLHLALVRHQTCAAHGEVAHVSDHGADSIPVADLVALSAVPADGHGDDHCLVVARTREEHGGATLPSASLLSPGVGDVPGVMDGEVCLSPIPLHRLAPKTSPPTSAT